MYCCAATNDQEAEEIDSCSLDDVAKLIIPFHGVDYAKWDPAEHPPHLTPEGKKNLTKIAKAVQNSAGARIKINGFCGPPIGPKMITLATNRTHVVHEFLKEHGCKNEVVINPLGFEIHDTKGPRCEVQVCPVEETKAVAPVAAPVPVEEKEVEPYLSVSFGNNGGDESSCVTKTWLDRPLGFTYTHGVSPVRVTKVVKGSRAHLFGVTEGMEVQAIQFTGQSKVACSNGKYEEVHKLLVEGTSILPHESDRPWLTLVFHDPTRPDELKSKTWYTKPLGLTFTADKSPLRIDAVVQGSRAWELGVQAGMHVRSIEFQGQTSVEVTDKVYKETSDLLLAGMKILADAA